MEMLSSTYGWTPNEIRQIDEDDIRAYLDILYIRHKHEENELKKIKKR